ncbi:MAG: HAD-IIIC family phosphatase [Kiloniellales bacterium]
MWSAAQLPWLPEPPADFRQQCKSLDGAPDELAQRLSELAGYRLDTDRLFALDKAATRLLPYGAQEALQALQPFRLALLSNATTSAIAPAVAATGLRYGLHVEVIEPAFGQIFQSALDPKSDLYQAQPHAVLLALDHRAFDLNQDVTGDESAADAKVRTAVEQMSLLSENIRKHSDATAILQTIVPPAEALFGHLDGVLPGTRQYAVERFNTALRRHTQDSSYALLDLASLAASVGTIRWHDPVMWHAAKLPFAGEFVPLYADHVCRILSALRGRSRKCLVLDLDNTVWGGEIGDIGVEGIVLGQGNPVGEAFLEVQRTALNLRERGIVLAVCSRNDEETARLPFRDHPDMLLREDHVAVFLANWRHKTDNLQEIAQTLSLGLDSLVFLDDNPAERAAVRARVPTVAAPELPADPAFYPLALTSAGYFESLAFVPEDRQRATYYEANAKRVSLQQSAGSIDDYLSSLKMNLSLKPFDAVGRARITQLINKTNQFNLTTRRYTEDQVEAMEDNPNVYTLQVRLSDSFGDSGMISVIVCRKEAALWRIDTWLMSCRVLGRKIENAVLNRLAADAKAAGAECLIGSYIPTPKNKLVADHYETLGFRRNERKASSCPEWSLRLSDYVASDVPITVIES